MVKKLLSYITNFKLLDLLGFARLLKVEEIDDFEEFVTNIVVAFKESPRRQQKSLLKLAKKISEENISEAKNS